MDAHSYLLVCGQQRQGVFALKVASCDAEEYMPHADLSERHTQTGLRDREQPSTPTFPHGSLEQLFKPPQDAIPLHFA
eukprot:5684700-Amphidinium_carterae.1